MDDGAPTRDPRRPADPPDYEDLLADAPSRSSSPSTTRTRPPRCATRPARPATPRASSTRTARSTCTRSACSTHRPAIGMIGARPVLPVVPMFHANAWGCAHAPLFAGAELVLPGPQMTPPAIAAMLERGAGHDRPPACRRSGWACCRELDGRDLSSLRAILCGGSAVPKALSEAYREKLGHADPAGLGHDRDQPARRRSTARVQRVRRAGRGRAAPTCGPRQGIAAGRRRHRGSSSPDTLTELPWDDEATGELQVRGPWIAGRLLRRSSTREDSFTADGWLRTGDVGGDRPRTATSGSSTGPRTW